MENILSQVSNIIIAGVHAMDQQMFDGIRNLSNMSLISYPKNRILQIILDPRIISKDTMMFAKKCSDINFGSIRHQIIRDLSKCLPSAEIIMMLKSFTHKLLDNDEILHIHGNKEKCEGKVIKKKSQNLIKLLYDKCQSFGLPYGYLNLYSPDMLMKLARSKMNIAKLLINDVNDVNEFKAILQLCASNYQKVYKVTKILQVMSDDDCPKLYTLLQLPEPVIKVLLHGIELHEVNSTLSYSRIQEVLQMYNNNHSLFLKVKDSPLLAKLVMTHLNTDIMSAFLDIICYNEQRINEINELTGKISSFLFSYLADNVEAEDFNAKCLIELAKKEPKRCASIISYAPTIKSMCLELYLVCELVNRNSAIFDLLFDSHHNNLNLIIDMCKRKNIMDPNILLKQLFDLQNPITVEFISSVDDD